MYCDTSSDCLAGEGIKIGMFLIVAVFCMAVRGMGKLRFRCFTLLLRDNFETFFNNNNNVQLFCNQQYLVVGF